MGVPAIGYLVPLQEILVLEGDAGYEEMAQAALKVFVGWAH